MRTLEFDKIAGSNFEQWSVSDTGLVEAMHMDEAYGSVSVTEGRTPRVTVQSSPCFPAKQLKKGPFGLFYYSADIVKAII